MSGVIRLDAGHDRNGNSRRVYVIIEGTEIKGVVEEGAMGISALHQAYPRLKVRGYPPTFKISPSEYRTIVNSEKTGYRF